MNTSKNADQADGSFSYLSALRDWDAIAGREWEVSEVRVVSVVPHSGVAQRGQVSGVY